MNTINFAIPQETMKYFHKGQNRHKDLNIFLIPSCKTPYRRESPPPPDLTITDLNKLQNNIIHCMFMHQLILSYLRFQ